MTGGDGQLGSPNTGWPRYDRIAMQPAAHVGPGQVAWFQFTAYVLQPLGVRDAMNLDGGGMAAMYIGGAYRVGPGRQLPNAVLLMRP